MLKQIYLCILLIVIIASNVACSSDQETTDTSQSTLANSILGTWSGTPGLTVPSWGSTYSYESFTFYEDVVIFHGDDGGEFALLYNFSDLDTIELMDIVENPFGTLQITQEEPDSMVLSLMYHDDSDNVYVSSSLNKVANAESADVSSLQESILGNWNGESERGDVSAEFIAGSLLLTLDEEGDAVLFHYEFKNSDSLALYNPRSPEDLINGKIRMPNDNTILIWKVYDDEEQETAKLLFRLNRESTPPPIVERPKDEVLYRFYISEVECGYIDRDGNIAIEPTFAVCTDFHEGLAVVAPFRTFNGEDRLDYWGYIDNSGQFVIDTLFSGANYFSEGVAPVEDPSTGDVGYIDQTGEYIIPPQYDRGGLFSEGLAYVDTYEPEWAAYIDQSGQVIFELSPSNYIPYPTFHDGLLEINETYFDKTGQISFQVTGNARAFSEGLAAINDSNNTCHYINTEGDIVIQTEYWSCGGFSEGLAAVYNDDTNTCGYIDTDGNLVIDLRFDGCSGFSEDRAVVSVGDYSGYIDKQGNYIFEPYDFEFADNFREGLARISNGYNWGYIDTNGNYVLKP